MSINLSIRNYRVTIAGLDCTPALISLDGSDSKLDQSGLITFTGTIVLGRPDGFESLDDRRNRRWSRGSAITVEIADRSGTLRPAPRGAKLFILSSLFDLKTRKLTLQVGDAFALLNFKEGKGDRSGICLGTQTSRTEVIDRLLQSAGTLPLVGTVPGSLSAPTPRLLEGSYIEQAGAIAAAAGYFLYVDRAGHPHAKRINTNVNRSFALSLNNIADYQRIEGEQAPNRVLVRGRATIVRQTGDSTETVSEEMGPALAVGRDSEAEILLRRTRTRDRFDRATKVRTIRTWIDQAAGMTVPNDEAFQGRTDLMPAEYRIETFFYETNAPLKDGDTRCQQGNQGRLKRRTLEVWKPKGVALREIYDTYPPKVDIPFKYELIPIEAEETIYQYEPASRGEMVIAPNGGFVPSDNDEDVPELEKLGDSPRIVTTKRQAIGTVLPEDYAYSPNPRFIVTLSYRSLEVVERTIQAWKELKLGEWRRTERVERALAIAFPDLKDRLREKLQKGNKLWNPSKLLRLTSGNPTVTISNAGQAQPPAPDTYSPPFSAQDVSVTGKADLPVDAETPFRQRTREFSFEYLEATGSSQAEAVGIAREQARQLATMWGQILWGRYQSSSVTSDLGDDWFGYEPLDRVDVIEPEGVTANLADGFAIAMSENRCVVSFDGILLGWTEAETPTQINPIYQVRTRDEVAIGFGFIDRWGSYDRTPIEIFDSFAIAFSFKPEADTRDAFAIGFSFREQIYSASDQAAIAFSFDDAGSLYWEEITPQQWETMSELQWSNIV